MRPRVLETPPSLDEGDDNLTHVICCLHAPVALCGADLTHATPTESKDNRCVVCDDLEFNDYDYCPVAGRCIQ